MAGKLEKRSHDRFYFVLDEVGASSDIESEAVSDNESKPLKNPADEGVDLLKERDKENNDAIMTTGNQEMNNATELVKAIPSEMTVDSNTDNTIDEGEIVDDPSSPDDENTQENGNTKKATEQTPVGVVDMDVDSETDSVDAANPVNKMAPIIKLTFRDEAAEKLYKDSLLKFLSQKMKPCTVVTSSENRLEIEIFEEDTEKIIHEDLLDFTVDTTPDQHARSSRIPYYGRPHNVVLSDNNGDKQSVKNSAAPVSSCFNCLGNHNLRDCPKPKDFKAINRNRASKMNTRSSRYHLDENQKFSHIVPGEISKKLRSALNLHKDQQPEFIYRMRKLGYPPAWLEEARISHSGVAMYNNTGVPVLEEDEEEGEIVPDGAKDRYDITKIIEFPGFNAPLPKNLKEEGKYYKCPAISDEQSKENMIKELQPNAAQAYRKRSLKPASSEEQSPGPTASTSKRTSPTIEEMEERKRQLLMALDDESDSKLSQDTNSSIPEPEAEAIKEPVASTPSKDVGKVKNLDLGTPILKSVSPFSKLPAREQFSVDVSDVINFENLPNSTGKYENMTHLISKIRKFRDDDTKKESKKDVSMS